MARLTAERDFVGNDGRVGEAEPEDAAAEVVAVAVGELDGQLGFTDAAQAGGRGDLADGQGLAAFEGAGQGVEVLLAADEEGIGTEGQAGAGRERGRVGHMIGREPGQGGLGGGQGFLIHRLGWSHLVDGGEVDTAFNVGVVTDDTDLGSGGSEGAFGGGGCLRLAAAGRGFDVQPFEGLAPLGLAEIAGQVLFGEGQGLLVVLDVVFEVQGGAAGVTGGPGLQAIEVFFELGQIACWVGHFNSGYPHRLFT